MENDTQGGEEVCIGIDFGSTGVRAFAWSTGKIGKYFPNPHNSLVGLDGNSFPAHGYPYDDGAVYISQGLAPNREPESLKYGFYLLSGDPNNLMEQYPLIRRLRDADSLELRKKLRRGIVQLLRNLKNNIETNEGFIAHGWRIGRLCVTIPNQWTLEFEEVYTQLLARAFNWTSEEAKARILYYTETDALAHFLLSSSEYPLVAKLLRGREEQRVCLVLDFGGHNLNGAVFWIQSTQHQEPKFFRQGDAFEEFMRTMHGIGGGGEHLYYNVLEACEEKYKARQGAAVGDRLSAAAKEEIRRKFAIECRHCWGPGHYLPAPHSFHIFDKNFQHVELIFSKSEIDELWERAFGGVIKVVERELDTLKRLTSKEHGGSMPVPLVLAAGGSIGNKPLFDRLQNLINQFDIKDVTYVNKMGLDNDTVRLARGAPMATVDMITVEDFLRQGVGIGIQMRQRHSNDWDDSATTIFYFCTRTGHYRGNFDCQLINIRPGDEFCLVCDPWYADKNPNIQNDDPNSLPQISAERGYVLLQGQRSVLPPSRAEGRYFIKADIRGNGNNMQLVLDIALVANPNRARSNRYEKVDWRLPLYYEGGNNCVCVGERGKTLREVIRALGARRRMNTQNFLNDIASSP